MAGAYGGGPPSDCEHESEEQGGDQQEVDEGVQDGGGEGKRISMLSQYYEQREIEGKK